VQAGLGSPIVIPTGGLICVPDAAVMQAQAGLVPATKMPIPSLLSAELLENQLAESVRS
jgi:hypothetical protein